MNIVVVEGLSTTLRSELEESLRFLKAFPSAPKFAIQCYYGHRDIDDQVTERPRHCKPQSGAPSSSADTMPTVLRDGPYAFVFFSSDQTEPPHIHVKRDAYVCKFWLQSVVLAKNRG